MVDDGGKGEGRKRRLDDRTVPMPVPSGGTQSADTLEAAPTSFIGDEHLEATSGEPPSAARSQPAATAKTAESQPSFDDEVERHRVPPARPATHVRRSPLASTHLPAEAAAELAAETSGPTPSSVFASRSPPGAAAEGQSDVGDVDDGHADDEADVGNSGRGRASSEAPTAPIDAPTLPPTESSGAGSALSARSNVLVTAPQAPPPIDLDPDAAPTLEQTAALALSDLVEQSGAPVAPEARLPDRLDKDERERLANDETRIRTQPVKRTPDAARVLKKILLVVVVGLAAAASATLLRALWAGSGSAPSIALAESTAGASAPSSPPARVPEANTPNAPTDAPVHAAVVTDPLTQDVDVTTDAEPAAPLGARPSLPDARALRAGFVDRSGSGAMGLAQSLAAGVRPAMKAAKSAGFSVHGEVRRATFQRGEVVLDCSLTLIDARVRRVTLQASARANDAGQRADRLMRIAAERCGQSLAPDVEQALARVAQR